MGRFHRRVGLAGAAVIVVAQALAACGGGDDEVVVGAGSALPIGPPGFVAESTQSPHSTMWHPFEFVAADDLPSLGGDRQAYRITPDPDAMDLLAERLDVESIESMQEWTAHDDPFLVDLGGAWTFWSPALSDTAFAACDTSGECTDSSADMPVGTTAAQAEAVAQDLLDKIGLDLPATTTTSASHGVWSVTVQYELDRRPVQGLVDRVDVGDNSEIVSGFGFSGLVERVDEYPTVDAAAAVRRLNENWFTNAAFGYETDGGSAESSEMLTAGESTVPAPPSDPVVMTTTTAPDEAPNPGDVEAVPPSHGPTTTTILGPPSSYLPPVAPPVTAGLPTPNGGLPNTTTVTLTSVEWTVIAAPSWDRSGIYLVPAYLFSGDDGQARTVIAVTDEVIESQPAQEGPPLTAAPVPQITPGPTTTSRG